MLIGMAWLSYPGKWAISAWSLCNIPLFLTIISIVLILIDPFFNFPTIITIFLILGILLSFGYLIHSFLKQKISLKNIWESKWSRALGLTIIIFNILVALGLFALVFGEYSARNSIECDFGSCAHVNFTFKDPNLTNINSPKLILITYHDGKYFLSTQEKPIPTHPEIYIIPSDQISSIRMKNVENWSDPTQLFF